MTEQKEIVIALAGNPNTGKSTVFNALTGLKQHTGNWSGKTVVNAEGTFKIHEINFRIFDLPGIYSVFSDSAEEKVAKDFICLEKPDITLVILDATCLERNLNLALQIIEMTNNVIICLNLMDEAKIKNMVIDTQRLVELTGAPVITASARQGIGIPQIKKELYDTAIGKTKIVPIKTEYIPPLKEAIQLVLEKSKHLIPSGYESQWLSGVVVEQDAWFYKDFAEKAGLDNYQLMEFEAYAAEAEELLKTHSLTINDFRLEKTLCLLRRAENIASQVVTLGNKDYDKKERAIDKIILSKTWGIPIMLGLLGIIFWLTIVGANYPSGLLMKLFTIMGERLSSLLISISCPAFLHGILVDGIFRTVSWVVAVMLPPMAIFFPLFTFLEDIGLLPRIAFNMDGLFRRANAHGKQALTMCIVYFGLFFIIAKTLRFHTCFQRKRNSNNLTF